MHGTNITVRHALPHDYDAFARLFRELQVDDPIPTRDAWLAERMPSTWMATRDDEVVGYCYFQEYAETGYIRHVVAAPAARRRGVGRALMHATAAHLRARSKRFWRLNVMSDNHAARALYEALGMRVKYLTTSFLLPWAALGALPSGHGVVRGISPDRDTTLEEAFDLPNGQLASARGAGRILLEASSTDSPLSVGLAVFNPKFPGAFPFRVKDLDATGPMLAAMREHVPEDEHVYVVVEDNPALADLLESVGARVRHALVHMEGAL